MSKKDVLIGLLTVIGAGLLSYSAYNSLNSKPDDTPRTIPLDTSGHIPKISTGDPIVDDTNTKLKVLTLTDQNTVTFEDDVTYESAQRVIADLRDMASKGTAKRIYLLITSPGGSVLAGTMIIETMQGSKIPVDTVCVGLCASMGAHMHASGAKRYMTNKSILMYHPASGGVEGEFDSMVSRLSFLNRYVTKLDMYVADRAGVPYEDFKAKTRDELWLDAQDATFDGFNDTIVYLDDKREPKSPFSFLTSQEQGKSKPKSNKTRSPFDRFFDTETTPRRTNGSKSL